jgi:hypothetical protein
MDDRDKVRLEYAWKYFEFHANQRMTMFNFFIGFSALFIGACGKLFSVGYYKILFFILLFGAVYTLIFLFLDRRNEELVHIAEALLLELEKTVFFDNYNAKVLYPMRRNLLGGMDKKETADIPVGIFSRQEHEEDKIAKNYVGESKYSHGIWLPRMIFGLFLGYLCSATLITSHIKPFSMLLYQVAILLPLVFVCLLCALFLHENKL